METREKGVYQKFWEYRITKDTRKHLESPEEKKKNPVTASSIVLSQCNCQLASWSHDGHAIAILNELREGWKLYVQCQYKIARERLTELGLRPFRTA